MRSGIKASVLDQMVTNPPLFLSLILQRPTVIQLSPLDSLRGAPRRLYLPVARSIGLLRNAGATEFPNPPSDVLGSHLARSDNRIGQVARLKTLSTRLALSPRARATAASAAHLTVPGWACQHAL